MIENRYKDLVPQNSHPLNIHPYGKCTTVVTRPPLFEVYLRMAEMISKRSTCSRLQVGCVLTDMSLERVLSVGYNGNARGFPNECDSDEPGACRDIHAECNALIKASPEEKVCFVTDSPCIMCAKLMVNANVQYVYYRREYRKPAGIEILEKAGIPAIHYIKWAGQTW